MGRDSAILMGFTLSLGLGIGRLIGNSPDQISVMLVWLGFVYHEFLTPAPPGGI